MGKAFVPLKRLVKTELRILDPTQMEASFQYRMVVKGEDDRVAYPDSYQVESYFLFPLQMKISPSTYPLEYFYRDVKSFLNFRIPKLTFKEIMGFVEDSDRSPLLKIKEHIERPVIRPEDETFVIQEAQIFACSFFTFIIRKSRKVVAGLAKFGEGDEEASKTKTLIEDSFEKVNVIFQEWQKVLLAAEAAIPSIKNELREVDEYILNNIHDFLLKSQKSFDLHAGAQTRAWRTIVRLRIRALRIYSGQHNYLWIDDKSEEVELETYLHRRGFLKRRVWSALYLNTRPKSLFKIQRQAGAMMAAGIAGLWAAVANLLLAVTGFYSSKNAVLSASSIIALTALTIAYILKDRIKEIGKSYFKGGLFHEVPDSSSKIVYRPTGETSKALEIGFHEEKAEFVEIDDLPKNIRSLMEQMAPERLNAEALTIIHYRKRIGLDGEKIQVLKRKIRALYTFFRLNVSGFLTPLDLPFEELAVSTSRLHATVRQVPKVYYLDLVLHITTSVEGDKKNEFEYYRMVLDKRGIKRITKLPLPVEFGGAAHPSQPKGRDVSRDEEPGVTPELDDEREVLNSIV
ncbi:MAG: hypothetical protein H7249_15060 [Chitinophagaceae bacterium]|nr:hypothetical protein [Oligoflexus sp.]